MTGVQTCALPILDAFFVLLVSFGFLILLFLLLRKLVLWYFRINERVKLMEEQVELLKRIDAKLNKE